MEKRIDAGSQAVTIGYGRSNRNPSADIPFRAMSAAIMGLAPVVSALGGPSLFQQMDVQ